MLIENLFRRHDPLDATPVPRLLDVFAITMVIGVFVGSFQVLGSDLSRTDNPYPIVLAIPFLFVLAIPFLFVSPLSFALYCGFIPGTVAAFLLYWLMRKTSDRRILYASAPLIGFGTLAALSMATAFPDYWNFIETLGSPERELHRALGNGAFGVLPVVLSLYVYRRTVLEAALRQLAVDRKRQNHPGRDA